MVIKERGLLLGVYGFLFIPIVIFFTGFLKLWVGIPLSLLLGFVFYQLWKKTDTPGEIHITKGELIGGVFIVLVWVWLSGIGGFAFQNYDHNGRNAILRDLVNFNWPVYYLHLPGIQTGSGPQPLYAMIYYIGYFLPSALVGKILGLGSAFITLYIWTAAGIFFVVILLKKKWKASVFFILLLLVFFSGMDAVGTWLMSLVQPGRYPGLWPPIQHLEWWPQFFQYSSFTTQLFWVFNTAIPVWICVAIYLAFPNPRRMILLWSICFFFAPVPALGFFPLVVAEGLKDFLESKNRQLEKPNHAFAQRILFIRKRWLTFENSIGGIFIGLSIAYYSTNHMSATIRFFNFNVATFFIYLIFIFLEGILIWMFFAREMYKNPTWYAAGILLIACPFFVVGGNKDFVMRVSMPALFVLMVWTGEWLKKRNWTYRPILIGYLVIGALTPLYEINRSIYRTAEYFLSPRNTSETSLLTPQEVMNNKYIPELVHPGSLVADGFITLSNFPPSELVYYIGDIRGTFLQKYLFKSP
jgi:hypothetical protein